MGPDCPPHREQLEAWVDGELSPKQRASLDRHLERCESCSKELTHLRRLRQLLRTDDLVDVPPDLVPPDLLSASGPRLRLVTLDARRGSLSPRVLAAAAALLVAALWIVVVSEGDTPAQPGPTGSPAPALEEPDTPASPPPSSMVVIDNAPDARETGGEAVAPAPAAEEEAATSE